MMMTRHPSYLPLELMGCGSLVITNRNPDTSWLLKDNENCLLADLSPSSLAERIEDGLRDSALRAKVTRNASALVEERFRDWNGEMEKVYQYMVGQC
jgi:glycosyltransferase involved in cell wall biosynthesis